MGDAYDKIDHFLRNNLGGPDYAEYSAALDEVLAASPECAAAASPAPAGWRPEVVAFANAMEAQLRANDHKPGWKHDSPESLRMRIYDEWMELTEALRSIPRNENVILKEAADVANFAMMIADNWGSLLKGREEVRHE